MAVKGKETPRQQFGSQLKSEGFFCVSNAGQPCVCARTLVTEGGELKLECSRAQRPQEQLISKEKALGCTHGVFLKVGRS